MWLFQGSSEFVQGRGPRELRVRGSGNSVRWHHPGRALLYHKEVNMTLMYTLILALYSDTKASSEGPRATVISCLAARPFHTTRSDWLYRINICVFKSLDSFVGIHGYKKTLNLSRPFRLLYAVGGSVKSHPVGPKISNRWAHGDGYLYQVYSAIQIVEDLWKIHSMGMFNLSTRNSNLSTTEKGATESRATRHGAEQREQVGISIWCR